MTTLPLAILVHDGVVARAYLLAMADAGFQPAVVVRLVWLRSVADGQPVGRALPGALRRWYAARTQELALNYWPRQLRDRQPDLVRLVAGRVADTLGWPADYAARLSGPFDYRDHAPAVHDAPVDDFKDRALHRALQTAAGMPVIFTGGGILPAVVTERYRLLHVHPGPLPRVRGADGLLWSTLLQGHPSATCFLMTAGLDAGSVVGRRDFPALTFPLATTTRPDDATLYRAVYAFYDPICRAALLQEVVRRMAEVGVDAVVGGATDQLPTPGTTFHFMSNRLRREALQRLFPISGEPISG